MHIIRHRLHVRLSLLLKFTGSAGSGFTAASGTVLLAASASVVPGVGVDGAEPWVLLWSSKRVSPTLDPPPPDADGV